MYYARELFVKKGPLATLWLAGSVMRKVGRHQVVRADIEKMCDLVENPSTPFALPTQSILLRGVCRIEHKKATYLLEDAEGATGRLLEPTARVREHTTLAPNKIKARHETITYTDDDQARLAEEGFQTLAQLDDISLMVDSTGGELLFGDAEMKVRDIEESAAQGRMEDITLTQDLSQLGGEGLDSMDFGALDADVELGDGFGEAALDMDAALGAGAPSPALSAIEAAASGVPGLDLDAIAAPVRAKRGKKARVYVPVADEQVEVDDRTLRQWLADPSDLIVERPMMEPRVRARIPLDEFLRMPSSVNPIDHPSATEGVLDSFKQSCKNKVVVDEAGHTPAEIEIEMGGDAAWNVDEGYAAEEARAEEYESMVTGGDMEDLSRSIHMAEAGDQGEGMLFGLTEEQPEVRRTRRDVSGRFEVVTDMETPDIEVSDSQFAVPKEEQAAREKGLRPTIERRAVNRHTEIFRNELEKKFGKLAKARQPQIVALDDLLREILNGDPNRRDRSLAFFQVLVLTSLDIVSVDQDAPFADIYITKGSKWGVRFSASQMFSESGQSQ